MRMNFASINQPGVFEPRPLPSFFFVSPPDPKWPEAEQRAYGVTLLVTTTGKRFEARGTRIRLGRGRECEVQPVATNDTTVSRVHAELTVGAISDHYELIGFTYGLAARRAVANGPKRLSEQLQEISKGLNNTDDLSQFNESALAFHAAVVRAAASPRVRAVLRSTSGFVPGNFFSHIPGAAAIERRGTTAVRRAITADDGERAAEEYLKMLRRHGEMVIDVLDERRYFDLGSSGTIDE